MATTFLDPGEVAALTGRKIRAKQIEQLRVMGIPFFVNAAGRAVVVRSAIEGKNATPTEKKAWVPPGMRN